MPANPHYGVFEVFVKSGRSVDCIGGLVSH